jgi:hypothetical protein
VEKAEQHQLQQWRRWQMGFRLQWQLVQSFLNSKQYMQAIMLVPAVQEER